MKTRQLKMDCGPAFPTNGDLEGAHATETKMNWAGLRAVQRRGRRRVKGHRRNSSHKDKRAVEETSLARGSKT